MNSARDKTAKIRSIGSPRNTLDLHGEQMITGATMILPSEREAGSVGRQPVEGSLGGLIETGLCVRKWKSPEALKIPARRAEDTLRESAFSPFQAEPTHNEAPHGND